MKLTSRVVSTGLTTVLGLSILATNSNGALAGTQGGAARTVAASTTPFIEGWWAWPPMGVLNPFSPNAINLYGFINSPLAYYTQWSGSDSYIPEVASSWTMKAKPGDAANGVLTINVRPGAKWSDGTPITAGDVKVSLQIGMVLSQQVSSYIASISTPDAQTVVVTQNDKPFNLFKQQVLGTWIYSSKVWGKYIPSNVQQIYQTALGTGAAATKASAQLSKIAKQMAAVNIKNYISSGPFVVGQVSSSQIMLPKNENWWGAKNVHVPAFELMAESGNTQAYSYALGGRVDYLSTYAPPTVVDPFLAKPGDHIAAPNGTGGPGLYFNTSVKPYDNVAVRQAFAYIIDRNEVEQIAYPVGTSSTKAATVAKYPTGLPTLSYKWFTSDTQSKLNPYNKNVTKAAQLLQSAGLKKVNGSWQLNGKPLHVEVACPGAYTDWVAIAENVATQLSQFGIDAKVRSVDVTTYFTNLPKGDYPLAIGFIGSGNIAPWYSYGQLIGAEGLSMDSAGKIFRGKTSYNWGPEVQVPGTGKINVVNLWNQLVTTSDVQKESKAVNSLALAINQQLPEIDLLFNKFYAIFYNTNNWTGYPAQDNPLWDTNIPAGSPALMFVEQGYIKPAQ